jgi:hypothetical protein
MMLNRRRNGRNRNGHRNGASSNGHAKVEARALDEMPDVEEESLPGVWEYLYGNAQKVDTAKVSRIPGHMILPICIMRMQSRLCQLTGGPDDPDLQTEFERDFEELMIGLNGQGRTEGVTIASAEMEDEDDDMPSAKLFGNIR